MPRETLAELRTRLAELEARQTLLEKQNALLTEQNALLADEAATLRLAPLAQGAGPGPLSEGAARVEERGRIRPTGALIGRRILAGVLVVLGVLVTPLALLVQFAQEQVTNTEAFVATFGPLAESPEVQQAVTDAAVEGISNAINLEATTAGLLDALKQLDLTPELSAGLDLVKGPIVEGASALIRWGVESIVTSDQFPELWTQSLRLLHSELNATLRGDEQAIGQLRGDDVALELGPIVAFAKDRMLAAGWAFAQWIPDDVSIPVQIGTVAGIGRVKTFYALGIAAGAWLPILAAALLIGGIAVAPRRAGWVLGASIALGVVAILLGIGLGIGRTATTSVGVLDPDSLGVMFDSVTGALGAAVLALGAIAFVGIATAWVAGDWRGAAATRAWLDRGPAFLRGRLALTGPVSRFLERRRVALYWLVAAAVVVTYVFFRPLTIGVVVVAWLLGCLLVAAVESLRSETEAPDEDAAAERSPEAPALASA
ncbi:MAG: hypothetical protein J7480_08780 [Microbacteriaceae bacterium]|nr:hypothetical protein [Microbacteriaceae bacterium]